MNAKPVSFGGVWLPAGKPIHVNIGAGDLHLFDAASGKRIE